MQGGIEDIGRPAEVETGAGGVLREVGSGAGAIWGKGVPLTITPPPDKHRLGTEESEIGRKGIEPKANARIRRGAAGFLVWNSITFSGACLRFSEYSQVFPSVP